MDSIATVFTRHSASQSASAYRSWVKVGNERTCSVVRSAGTATKISVAPMSIPAASGRITGNIVCFALPSLLRFRLMNVLSAHGRRPESRSTGTLLNGIVTNLNIRLANVTTVLSTRFGTRLATGLDSSIARPVLTAASAAVAMITWPCSLPAVTPLWESPG